MDFCVGSNSIECRRVAIKMNISTTIAQNQKSKQNFILTFKVRMECVCISQLKKAAMFLEFHSDKKKVIESFLEISNNHTCVYRRNAYALRPFIVGGHAQLRLLVTLLTCPVNITSFCTSSLIKLKSIRKLLKLRHRHRSQSIFQHWKTNIFLKYLFFSNRLTCLAGALSRISFVFRNKCFTALWQVSHFIYGTSSFTAWNFSFFGN